jgi:hypothetical protein
LPPAPTRQIGEAGTDAVNRSGQAGSDGIRQGISKEKRVADNPQQNPARSAATLRLEWSPRVDLREAATLPSRTIMSGLGSAFEVSERGILALVLIDRVSE